MTRSLFPPDFIAVPIALLTLRDDTGERLPAPVLETWLDFRALAWGQDHTPEMAFNRLRDVTGKSRSTLCGHLAVLTHWFGLRWQISDNRLQVFFTEDDSLVAAPPESEKPDSPNTQILNDSDLDLKNVFARVQKAGLKPRRPDPRTSHAAIQACRLVTGRYPDRSLYDKLIAVLGETPNVERLWQCRQEWLERGYNPAAWKWAVDWYAAGITERGKKGDRPNASGNTGGGTGEAAGAPSAFARRLSGKG